MKRSILTIEDSKPLRYLLSTVLNNKYAVKTVGTGYEAMQLFTTDYRADLIIINISSLQSDNFELLEHFSTSSILKDIPVIVLSNSNEESLKTSTLEIGASAFYTKPFDPVSLTEKIDELLKNYMPQVIQKKRKVFNLNIF